MIEAKAQFDPDRRVREIIARVFQLTPEEAAGELRMGNPRRWDSMGHMQLVIELEAEFGLTFPTYAIAELVGVATIVQAIRQYRAH